MAHHFSLYSKLMFVLQEGCGCKRFLFAPDRPEDFGEFWLRKRRNFDPAAYRMKCNCKHTHEEHACYPSPYRCKAKGCGCSAFTSASVCAACDKHWADHDTVFETEKERKQAGRQIREFRHFSGVYVVLALQGGIAAFFWLAHSFFHRKLKMQFKVYWP